MTCNSKSENLFADYLKRNELEYESNYLVCPGNIDFKICLGEKIVLADVKEVRDRLDDKDGKKGIIESHVQIREDIKKLRKKFESAPSYPLVLVTMNFSKHIFTGFTVARALLGDIGTYVKTTGERSPFQHLYKGNAAVTRKHNTSIAGILVFTHAVYPNYFFCNPYALNPMEEVSFPNTSSIHLDREQVQNNIDLNSITIWPIP